MPYPVNFQHGNASNLPLEIQEGSFLYTDDTNNLYLDINGERHDVINRAVKNISGSSTSSFISLAGLDIGHYSLTGYYKIDSSYEVMHTSNILDVVVCLDETTSKKVVTFPSVTDGTYYINKLIYTGSVVETIEHLPIDGGNAWGEF